jgi:CDP-diacylglycerol---serine O-phosphatidyltransferase
MESGKKNVITKAFPAFEFFNAANLLTTAGVALNVLIAYMAARGNVKWAVWLYAFVLAIDAFDGKIARWLDCRTEFGARLDSLCDAVSFCVMPAAIAYYLGFTGPAAAALSILNAVAGIWRLAYFDVVGLSKDGDREYFTGSPTTNNAAVFYIVVALGGLFRESLGWFFYCFFAVSPVLMLVNWRIRKMGLFTKILYVAVPASALAYLFTW